MVAYRVGEPAIWGRTRESVWMARCHILWQGTVRPARQGGCARRAAWSFTYLSVHSGLAKKHTFVEVESGGTDQAQYDAALRAPSESTLSKLLRGTLNSAGYAPSFRGLARNGRSIRYRTYTN